MSLFAESKEKAFGLKLWLKRSWNHSLGLQRLNGEGDQHLMSTYDTLLCGQSLHHPQHHSLEILH